MGGGGRETQFAKESHAAIALGAHHLGVGACAGISCLEMQSLDLSRGKGKAGQPAGPILPQTPRPDTPSLHATVTTVSLAGGGYPSPGKKSSPAWGSRSPKKAPRKPGHITPGASNNWASPN